MATKRKEYTKENGALVLKGTMPVFDSNNNITLENNLIIPGLITKTNGTASYNQTLQNKSGTIALTSDIPSTSNFIPYGGVLMPTNAFGGKQLYINHTDNAFASADKKFYVTITKHLKESGGVSYPYADTSKSITDDNYYVDGPITQTLTTSAHNLFNGSYEDGITCEANGTTYLKIRIMFGSNTSPSGSSSYFLGYPYGYWYLSFYYNNTPNLVSQARVYNKYAAHTVGWHLYNATWYSGSASGTNVIHLITDTMDYQRTCVEFIVYGNTSSGRAVQITQIDYRLQRPNLSRDGSTVTKYGAQTLYWDFTWNNNHAETIKIGVDGNVNSTKFTLKGNVISPANGQHVAVYDNNGFQRTTSTFDGSTTNKFLSQKGTFEGYNNYYHTSGSWINLTYNATNNGGVGDLSFTIPTGTTGTTVALGNHTHQTVLEDDTGTSDITLQYSGKYKLTTGGTSLVFTMPDSDNTNWYPTNFSWTNGTTSGPTGTLTGSGMSSVSFSAIPSASKTQSGVITTGNQEISGKKSFTQRPTLQITRLPSEYQEVEYVHGDGTPYINTGLPVHMGWKYKITFKQDDTGNYRFWGVFNQQSYSGGLNCSFTYASGWAVRWETVSGQTRFVQLTAIDDDKHTLVIDKGVCYLDGENYSSSGAQNNSVVSNYNAYLFTINPGGTTPTTNLHGRIYEYEVWNGDDVLQQQLIPAVRKSDNKVGFYDLVNDDFILPVTGTFTAGNDVVDSEFLVFSDLANVATSGDYNDLINTPTIPTVTWRPIQVAGTTHLSNTSSSALNFLNSGNVSFTYNNGLYANVDLSSYWANNSNSLSLHSGGTTVIRNSNSTGDYTLDVPAKSGVIAVVDDIKNATLTIKANGTSKGTFTANASTNVDIDITASDLGLSSAMKFIGISTTDPKSTTGATVSGHTSWAKGEIVLYKRTSPTVEYNYEEYLNLTGSNSSSASPNTNWELLGDSDSYALNSVSITGTGALGGGGTLTTNRTITHNAGNAASKTSGFYKFSTDAYSHVNSVTSVGATDITTALGYTPYNSTNPDGYISTITPTTEEINVVKSNGISTTTVNGLASQGTLPTLTGTYTASSKNFSLSFSQGTLPTATSSITVVNGVQTESKTIMTGVSGS